MDAAGALLSRGDGKRVSGAGHAPETDLLELLRRERRDFLSYKRRIELERSTDREQARAEMAGGILPLLDELDRAFDHLPADLEQHPWVRGSRWPGGVSRRRCAAGGSSASGR